jgi:anti-anti-sigma regulatory factor
VSDDFWGELRWGGSTLALGGAIDADTIGLVRAIAGAHATGTGEVPDLSARSGGIDRVDCSGVTLFGAAGVTALLEVAGERTIQVVVSDVVHNTLMICGLENRFDLVAAVRSPSPPRQLPRAGEVGPGQNT